jgi:hypothetical protein
MKNNESPMRNMALAEQRNRIKDAAKRMVWVTFQREGIHRYPAAETDANLKTGDEYDVSFLAFPHRHIFHFKVSIEVEHSNRAIEFIQFKRWLENLYKDQTLQLDYKSCEMMAEDLYEVIATKYPHRTIQIEISEDGENGALLTFGAPVAS